MGQHMQGKRVELSADYNVFDLKIGEYGKADDGAWWLMPPNSGPIRIGPDDGWTLQEHDDGTLTISPSIWIGKPHGWHGFLKRGVWETV